MMARSESQDWHRLDVSQIFRIEHKKKKDYSRYLRPNAQIIFARHAVNGEAIASRKEGIVGIRIGSYSKLQYRYWT